MPIRHPLLLAFSGAVLVSVSASPVAAQIAPDPGLMAAIARIPAIDNHAHAMTVLHAGERPDSEYDALPVEGMEPFELPVRMSPSNPEFVAAWKALYGYPYDDMSAAHLKAVDSLKAAALREHGDGYAAWVLDRSGIETMIANRIAMGRGLEAPRFRWATYVDPLLYPVSTAVLRARNHDAPFFFGSEEKLLRRYLSDLGLSSVPATLDDYLAQVLTPTLERQRTGGALAVKFEAAYLRSLDFEPASKAEAGRIYAKYARGGDPSAAELRTLSDYLFRRIAAEAGRLGMAVHLHTGAGAGAYYELAGSNPLNLESVFDDASLRGTKFVLVHGGWPFYRETGLLLGKPNVYADFSYQGLMLPPRRLAEVIRTWLELYPAKVLFATDAFALSPEVGWEDVAWLNTHNARTALALALTGMMRDGEVTRERALELARMVLRDNAIELYHLTPSGGRPASTRAHTAPASAGY